jgi:hypothetical protein
MQVEFVVPTKRFCNVPQEDLDKTIQVRMEDLFRLDEIHWQEEKNIKHIQLLHKKQKDEKKKDKKF